MQLLIVNVYFYINTKKFKIMKLQKKLRTYKFKSGLTYKQLSKRLGVSEQTVRNWCGKGKKIKTILEKHSSKLEEETKGYITYKDCGYHASI